jgi:hypothetical protein
VAGASSIVGDDRRGASGDHRMREKKGERAQKSPFSDPINGARCSGDRC